MVKYEAQLKICKCVCRFYLDVTRIKITHKLAFQLKKKVVVAIVEMNMVILPGQEKKTLCGILGFVWKDMVAAESEFSKDYINTCLQSLFHENTLIIIQGNPGDKLLRSSGFYKASHIYRNPTIH